MAREVVRDEFNREIGWVDKVGDTVHYFTYKHGEVGQYDTRTKQYRRWKTYPGHPVSPFAGADYGMTDILYWAEH